MKKVIEFLVRIRLVFLVFPILQLQLYAMQLDGTDTIVYRLLLIPFLGLTIYILSVDIKRNENVSLSRFRVMLMEMFVIIVTIAAILLALF